MNSRSDIFGSEMSIQDKFRESLSEVAYNPRKLSLIFWLFRLQLCLAVFLLVSSILLALYRLC
nr:MAG TPA: hypothetical protein [Caudoviricetes sp.]